MARIDECPKQRKLRNEMTGATNKGAKYFHVPKINAAAVRPFQYQRGETRTSGR